jgi:hypothetical protein
MSILDSLLGGSNDGQSTDSSSSSRDLDTVLATSPGVGLHASDILQSSDGTDGSSLTGIGEVGLDLSAPTLLGISSSSSDDGDGGLLGGLI